MKAPCCLLGAAALPRPPEHARGSSRSGRAFRMSRVPYTYMCVWWLVLVVVTSASEDTDCPVRSDALDVASRAYVSPQVVEAEVKDISPAGPGQPYTVTVSVSRILRRYRGPSRLRRRANLTLTFRHPLADTDSENSDQNSDSVGDCLVSASLKRRRYLLFLSGPKERGAQPVPVAPPELATKKLRRVVRKTVCNKCVQPPTATRLRDDSVVRDHNLTLECTVQGMPAPHVLWYKDDFPLSPNIHLRITTRRLRRKRMRRKPNVRERRETLRPLDASVGRAGRRRTLRRRVVDEGEGMRRRRRGRGGEEPGLGGEGAGVRGDAIRRILRDGGEETRRLPVSGRRRMAGAVRSQRPEADPEDGRQRLKRKRTRERVAQGSTIERKTGESTNSDTDDGSRRRRKKKKRRQDKDNRQQALVSTLTIFRVQESDAGVYKCVAKSVAGEDSSKATIRVVPPIDPHPFVDKCPYAGYCLNGGTCMMFKIVGELVCQCAEGYKGQRCQEKEVYPTFSRSCQGPLRHLRHSRGLRCPRNQPTALWELLQQSLAHKQKVSPWTKPHLLSWSPIHTGHAYWHRYMRPAHHSSNPLQSAGVDNPAVTKSNLPPTASVLNQNLSSSDHLPATHTAKNPYLLDSHLEDLPQILRQRDQLGQRVLSSDPLATRQPYPQQPYPEVYQAPTLMSQLKKRVGHDSRENPHLDRHSQSPALRSDIHKEGEPTAATNPHRRTRHGHRQQQHFPEERDSHAHNKAREERRDEPLRKPWDQKVSEAGLSWSATPTPPLSFTTPRQENQRQ